MRQHSANGVVSQHKNNVDNCHILHSTFNQNPSLLPRREYNLLGVFFLSSLGYAEFPEFGYRKYEIGFSC